MKTIQIIKSKSSNLNPLFSAIATIDVEDTPFDSGAYGEVYISKRINGNILSFQQVLKVFIDDGSGSAKRGLETIRQLQEQIIILNADLRQKKEKLIEDVTALWALPQFSYEGRLNGKTVVGYSANLLDSSKWLLFDKIFNEPNQNKKKEYRNVFYNLQLDKRLDMAYNLTEGFYYLEKMKFIYADLNPKNFFVNKKEGQLCLIDYEGGAVMDNRGYTPETYGKLGEWLAPEIQSQLLANNNRLIKVDLHTDTWAVAIGIHFLLFPYHPLFYLKIRGKKEKEYFLKYKWPEISKTDANYRKDVDKPYDNYLNKIKTMIPPDLVKAMSETINYGYANPSKRLSYKQWMNTLKKQMLPPMVISFLADKQIVLSGHSLRISWQAEQAKTILLNGQDILKTTGKEIRLTKDGDYKLAVTNNSGKAEKEISIKVLPTPKISSVIVEKPIIQYVEKIVEKPIVKYKTKIEEKTVYVDRPVEKKVVEKVTNPLWIFASIALLACLIIFILKYNNEYSNTIQTEQQWHKQLNNANSTIKALQNENSNLKSEKQKKENEINRLKNVINSIID
jgi:serine/threonine protein kinase